MRKSALLLLLIAGLIAPRLMRGQSAPVSRLVIRYHFGDDPAWSSPSFDDSSWPIAPHDSWPGPPFHSDGFVWIRAGVPVPAISTGTVALRVTDLGAPPEADRIFVNGRSLGGEGEFPPAGQPRYLRLSDVFVLPAGTAVPGTTAVVAVRLWYVPAWRRFSNSSQFFTTSSRFEFLISDSDTAELTERAAILSATLDDVPDFALNALLALVGLGLLVFWFWSRRSELLWCAAWLISYPAMQFAFDADGLGSLSIPWRNWILLQVLLTALTMVITVEFIWTVHSLRAPGWRRAAHLSWILYSLALLVSGLTTRPSQPGWWSQIAILVFVQIFNAITLGTNLWVLLIRRYNRAIAAAMTVIPIASALGYFGWWENWRIGGANIGLFDLGFLLSGFAIAAMLVQRAMRAWREGNDLRVEFEAAREIQQQLVMADPKVPGFIIDCVYAPAKQVGGDFYRILPDGTGGILVVVGDVSGKGLPAAMTVSAIMGALRTLPSAAPAEILSALNRSLIGNLRGGFVTCCVALIAKDGSVTLANAGHLSPYRNGEEISLENGLPLGIAPDATYSETTIHLAPNDCLTLLSDGVVEAQSSGDELFGFDRTKAISAQPAKRIAAAAKAFGQQDDITVLTLTFAPVEVLHA